MLNLIRTQIQLTPQQMRALRDLSKASGKSAAELIRSSLDSLFGQKHVTRESDRLVRALRVAGSFSSGLKNVSAEHDKYLAAAFLK